MQPDLTNTFNHKGKEYKFDIFLQNDFNKVKDIQQVYTFVLSKDLKNVLVAYNKSGMWILPGGGVEEGETLIDTLIREVKEESNKEVDIETITPFFYQKAYKKDEDGKWEYTNTQARYIAVVEKDTEFEHDPDEDILEVKWVPIQEIDTYLQWGETIQMVKRELPKYIDKIGHNKE